MTVQAFKDLLSQRPFRPFRLVMSGGQTYDVRHPEMALLTRSELLVGTGDMDDGVCGLQDLLSVTRGDD
jgi:hypothetical protein